MTHLSLKTLSSYQIQRKNFEGRTHLVAPVVLLTEGVHNGSSGPALYTTEELSHLSAAWNGVPIPILHPIDEEGNAISCNSPEVLEKSGIGRLFNVVYSENALRGELWIDEAKVKAIAPHVYNDLLAGKMIEVSTGLFSDNEATSGEWNGEHYEFIVRNIRPDHLALLPGQVGACSTADGCGVRANQEKDSMTDNKAAFLDFINKKAGTSFEDRRRAIQKVMDNKDVRPMTEGAIYAMHYVVATYEDHFICMRETNSGTEVFKCSYKMSANGEVEIDTTEVKVKEVTTWIEITDNTVNNEVKEVVIMKCCPEKVEAFVGNAENSFTETDKVWLMELTPEAFDAIVANTEKKEVPEVKQATTIEEVMANTSDAVVSKLKAGLAMLEEKKTGLIDGILANAQNKFEKAELETMEIANLEKIAAFAKTLDYSGNSPALVDNSGTKVKVLDLPVLTVEK
jgi:hypothetical protein